MELVFLVWFLQTSFRVNLGFPQLDWFYRTRCLWMLIHLNTFLRHSVNIQIELVLLLVFSQTTGFFPLLSVSLPYSLFSRRKSVIVSFFLVVVHFNGKKSFNVCVQFFRFCSKKCIWKLWFPNYKAYSCSSGETKINSDSLLYPFPRTLHKIPNSSNLS